MSFVSRNKTWLLPLLAIGIGAVAWFDIRSFQTPDATPSAQGHQPAEAPPAAADAAPPPDASTASAPMPSATPASPLPALGPDAWADLSLLNGPHGALGSDSSLAAQATRPLTDDQLHPPGATGSSLAFATPSLLVLPGAAAGASAPPPDLEFISRTPEGLRAWYQGVGYRVGQTLVGSPYRIRDIHPPRVTLEGPAGTVEQSTFLYSYSEPAAPPVSKETP